MNPNQQAMYDRATRAAGDLRGQLQALVQLAHTSSEPDDVEVVRGALFRAHGRGGDR